MTVTVHADDMGMFRGITNRIAEAYRTGRLHRCSVVANGIDFNYAVEVLRKLPNFEAGVHINLVEGRSVMPPDKVPLLVDNDGFFRHTWLSLWLLYLTCPRRREALVGQLEAEIFAQIDRVCRQIGSWTGYVDSHRYTHLIPFVGDLLVRRGVSWGVKEVRIVNEPGSPWIITRGMEAFSPLFHLKRLLLNALSRRLARTMERCGIIHPDITWGLGHTKMASKRSVGRILTVLQRRAACRCELVFHPGPAKPEDWTAGRHATKYRSFYTSSYREEEYRVLVSLFLRQHIDKAGRYKKTDIGSWNEYWDNDRLFGTVMPGMTDFFFRKSLEVVGYSEEDDVLDIGCGPGYLEDNLCRVVRRIDGVDTSPAMIEICRKKHASSPHISFSVLDAERYTDLSFLESHTYSITICLSVIQYYRNFHDLEALILGVRRVSKPGGQLLIADIPVRSSPVVDSIELIRSAAAEKIMIPALMFLVKASLSRYMRYRKKLGLLSFQTSQLENLLESIGLEYRWIDAPLTFNKRRKNILIRMN